MYFNSLFFLTKSNRQDKHVWSGNAPDRHRILEIFIQNRFIAVVSNTNISFVYSFRQEHILLFVVCLFDGV